MSAVIDGYDAAFFDLDGVIYLGPKAVPGAAGALRSLRQRGTKVMYVTNNAAREAQVVIDQLNGLGFEAMAANVLTSAQVAAVGLAAELPAGSRVLVAGSRNLAGLVAAAGFEVVGTANEQPAAVIQGYDPDLSWRLLDEVALAIQGGARWFATNDDASRPTDRGLVPGVGGALAVVRLVVGGEPTTFGKPFRPMLAEAMRRTRAQHPVFVGDRLDTDISGAHNAGIDSLLVFSGAHGKHDLVAAPPEERPTHIGANVSALLRGVRPLVVGDGRATCRAQVAVAEAGRVRLAGSPRTPEDQFDALWALTQLVWTDPGLDASGALAALDLVQ
ncbi:MAG: HAD-IIA family hydrolase [Propionicimonas sp.]|uniref:HAD-IIA family hydrolase n=1 Tax=Propionicimonas sp. TaxID=1955623 RepID=UPI003D119C68